MDYNNPYQNIRQLKAELDKRGIGYKSKARRADLIAILVMDDHEKAAKEQERLNKLNQWKSDEMQARSNRNRRKARRRSLRKQGFRVGFR